MKEMLFQAVAESHDFAGDAEGTRQKINSWVERETNDKIQNLLPEGSVDALTALILVNAMYFKVCWTIFQNFTRKKFQY